ncbi:MAG: S41 family peptidase [Acidobacteriota bacterium]
MSRFFQRLVFVLSVAIFAALGLGFVLGEFGWFGVHAGGEQDGAYREMHVYAEVLKKIQTDYVTKPSISKVTDGALHGLLDSLDADSSYLTPTEYKIYKERPTTGNGQIGITVSKRYGYATIVNVLPGSPADQDHLEDGDVIEAVEGQSTRQLSLAVIRMMLEGKPGTPVKLELVRPFKPAPDKLAITRAAITLPALATQEYDGSNILYLKPGVLDAAHVNEIAAKLKSAKNQKILIDLRDTSGVDEQQGLRLANFFIKQGTLAMLVGQKVPQKTFTADPAKSITSAPLVVLVNRGTYGAAELFAAAVEDLKRGDVVGERTFGEGSVQKTMELPDGAALMLTVAKYESPSGSKIQDNAVNPTVAVAQPEQNEFQPAPKTDDILDKGLSLLKTKAS